MFGTGCQRVDRTELWVIMNGFPPAWKGPHLNLNPSNSANKPRGCSLFLKPQCLSLLEWPTKKPVIHATAFHTQVQKHSRSSYIFTLTPYAALCPTQVCNLLSVSAHSVHMQRMQSGGMCAKAVLLRGGSCREADSGGTIIYYSVKTLSWAFWALRSQGKRVISSRLSWVIRPDPVSRQNSERDWWCSLVTHQLVWGLGFKTQHPKTNQTTKLPHLKSLKVKRYLQISMFYQTHYF